MNRILFLIIFFFLIQGCGNGNWEEQQKKLDKIYGKCDNPNRTLTTKQYKICKDKEAAGGASFFGLDGDLNDLLNKKSGPVVYQYSVNPDLWAAAIDITKKYPLKIADNQGGYIETDWIYEQSNADQRCLIKVQVTSQELTSTGISTNFVCENKNNENWYNDNKEYVEEEKQLTLKILSVAQDLSNKAL